MLPTVSAVSAAALLTLLPFLPVHLQDEGQDEGQDDGLRYPEMPAGRPPVLAVDDALAAEAAKMKPYVDRVPGMDAMFRLVPIPGGTFTMGSPKDETDRKGTEGPRVQVAVDPFWMGVHEVTWDEYHVFMYRRDIDLRSKTESPPEVQDAWADAVSRPTPPYVPMDFEMGVSGYPAICMTQFAAKQYTKWVSMKTGRFYRLPTEAEWEYACRAGTDTAYSFGAEAAGLEEAGWYFDNADDQYQPVGKKKPNAWGLHDMHGNVAEWVLDAYDADWYKALARKQQPVRNPINWPTRLYPRVVRGGSWDDDPDRLRSAARRASKKSWKVQAPQLPERIWYHTDATFVGFRLVRPLVEPSSEEMARYWEADRDDVRAIQMRQREGKR